MAKQKVTATDLANLSDDELKALIKDPQMLARLRQVAGRQASPQGTKLLNEKGPDGKYKHKCIRCNKGDKYYTIKDGFILGIECANHREKEIAAGIYERNDPAGPLQHFKKLMKDAVMKSSFFQGF